jgi:hypothetical protein
MKATDSSHAINRVQHGVLTQPATSDDRTSAY